MFDNDKYKLRTPDYTGNRVEHQPGNIDTKSCMTQHNLSDANDFNKQMYLHAQPPIPKKKRSRHTGFATAIIICLIGSAAFAFGGTYLANSLNGTSPDEKTNVTDTVLISGENHTVLYQTVLRTATDNNPVGKMSIEDVVVNVKHSVVEITTETVSTSRFMRQFVSTGAGSGVIVSTNGYILTNNHVVGGAQTIKVRLSNEAEYDAILIGADAKTDLAVIKIDANDLQPAVLGHSASLLVGQSAIAIGNPLGELGGTVTAGIISALDREITVDGKAMSLLQTDTAINPGNSGGGLFDLYGELVGIINAKSSGSEIEGLGFAIPIDTAKVVIEQILEYGYVKDRIDTGFTLVDIQDAQTAMSYRINQLGLYISKSINVEFQSGDRITAVDGQTVSSLAEWNTLVSKYSVGDTIDVTVARSGRSITYSLTLTEFKT